MKSVIVVHCAWYFLSCAVQSQSVCIRHRSVVVVVVLRSGKNCSSEPNGIRSSGFSRRKIFKKTHPFPAFAVFGREPVPEWRSAAFYDQHLLTGQYYCRIHRRDLQYLKFFLPLTIFSLLLRRLYLRQGERTWRLCRTRIAPPPKGNRADRRHRFARGGYFEHGT